MLGGVYNKDEYRLPSYALKVENSHSALNT